MKKLLLSTLLLATAATVSAQCVYTCSNYAVSAITHSVFPAGTAVTTFTTQNGAYSTDDGATSAIPIGFNFDFYCQTYSNVYIVTNGFITFDNAVLQWPQGPYVHATQNIFNSAEPNAMIAFNMTDLNPLSGGTISYTTVGSAPNRMFIVTYSNVPCFTQTGNLNTGQIVLYETSNIIEIHTTSAFSDSNQGTLGSTQGIENETGTAATTPPGRNCNNTWAGSSAANTAYQFSPYTAAPLGSITGNTVLCEGSTGSYIVPSSNGALGYNWSAPSGWIGSSTTTAVSFTASASGNVSVTASYTCGISPVSTLAVNVLPAPVVGINSATPAIVCSGKTVEVQTNGAVNYTLEPGTNTGPGPFIITPMVLPNTVFTVTGTDANGCNSLNQATVSVLVLESPTVSVNSGSVCQGQPFTMTPSGADNYSFTTPFATVTNTVPGLHTYSVIGTATNGCKGEAVSSLSVVALPAVGVLADREKICRNEEVKLTASGAAAYAWSSTVATTQQVVLKPQFTAVHTVTGTSAEGCVATASILVEVQACTGLAEQNATGFRVYPNPSNGDLTVETATGETAAIYDLLGREVSRVKLNAGVNRLKQDLVPGKYFLRGLSSGLHHSFVIVRE